jgi:hypothetical protein
MARERRRLDLFFSVLGAALCAACLAAGCGGDDDDGGGDSGAAADFEIAGTWAYSGSAPVEMTLAISNAEAVTTTPDDSFGVTWSLLEYDNDLDRARMQLTAVTGDYLYDVGQIAYAAYAVSGDAMDFYIAADDYPTPSGGTEGVDYWSYTRAQ